MAELTPFPEIPPPAPSKPPRSLRVIGSMFAYGSALSFLSGSMGFLALSSLDTNVPVAQIFHAEDAPQAAATINALFSHVRLFSLAEALVSAYIFVSAVQFQRRKRWARKAMERIIWFNIIMAGVVSFVCITFLPGALSKAANLDEVPGASESFRHFLWGMGLVVLVGGVLPMVYILKIVKGEKIRSAMTD